MNSVCFDPTGAAWLPVLHTERDTWCFTVLFSNTALAHQLRRTGEGVVGYFHTETRPEGQLSGVTETRGPSRAGA